MVITDDIKKKIAALAEKYQLKLVVLFGSQATGKTHKGSDVDIAFLSEKPMDFVKKIDMQPDFAAVFKRADVELADLRKVSPLLLKRVADYGVVLYEQHRGAFAYFRMYAFKLYIEAKPLFALEDAFLKRYLKQHAG